MKDKLLNAGIELTLISEEQDRIEIFVSGDENDGDCVDNTDEIETIDELKEVIRVFDTFKLCESHNWENHELSDTDLEIIRDYVPYGSYDDIHTLEEVSITLFTKSGERYSIY